jgi:nucleoside-diphosphate-sugar epimerase
MNAKKALVTGVAGFIGSHLAQMLLARSYQVVGLDSLTPYYSPSMKRANIAPLLCKKGFAFMERDILDLEKDGLPPDLTHIYHLAAQPGVRSSWGISFDTYLRNNVLATQRLLELSISYPLKKFAYASSSSVYGESHSLPLKEDGKPSPVSPYGLTKYAGEGLCTVYSQNYGIPTISLRYFTVYGSRQRPDMAFHRFIKAILRGEKVKIFGDGEQRRDFTFVSDVVEATVRAGESPIVGEALNVGGGRWISINDALKIIEKICGRKAEVEYDDVQMGDVKDTLADTSKIQGELGYKPEVKLEKGLREEIEWMRSLNR